ncbi:MAG: ATP-binding protein [Syntrophobacteraceae bacterium]|nr:response regulator [Desulfobacteraceae bacterium]
MTVDRPVDECLKAELLGIRRREEEMIRVYGMIERLVELLPEKAGVRSVCDKLVRIVIEETDFENCSIALWDAEHKDLALAAAFGLIDQLEERPKTEYHGRLRFAAECEVASRTFSNQEPVFIENTGLQPIPAKPDAVVHPVSLICLPLLDLGVLNISKSRPSLFPNQEKRNWIILSHIVGQIIQSAVFQERLRDENRNLQVLIDEKVRSLDGNNRQLAASNQFLEGILDHIPEGVCCLDSEGRIARVNAAMETLHGAANAGLLTSSPAVFFQDPRVFGQLMEMAGQAGSARLTDVVLLQSDGSRYPADVFLTKIGGEAGRHAGYLLIVYDMTEKKVFTEQLLRAEKLAAMGTMAGGVAHDFNNLLMMILGNTQLLLLQVCEEPLRRRLLNVEEAVQEAAKILRRLQVFSASKSENRKRAKVVDVNDVLREVVDLTRPQWKSTFEKQGLAIDLRLELCHSCFAVIHVSDLREILTNLILNAVDAMPGGGVLTLSSRSDGADIVLSVADTGVGMTGDTQRKLFDPFYTTKGLGKSGLGLSVVWNLVNQYGGEIEVMSQPGKGSVFEIRLPGTETGQEDAVCRTSPVSWPERRILIVDDDREVLRLLRDMIRLSGYKAVAIEDPGEAMQILDGDSFDLVLTDLGMPVVSGWEIARKTKEKCPETPVVLITGWGAQYEQEDLSKRGIDLVVSKPLSYDKLLKVLGNFLHPPEVSAEKG